MRTKFTAAAAEAAAKMKKSKVDAVVSTTAAVKVEERVEDEGTGMFKTLKPPKGWVKYSELLDMAGVAYDIGDYDPYVMPPYSDSEWDEEYRKYIPSLPEDRVINWDVDSKIAEALSLNAKPIITSPPGAGKSSGLQFYAALMRQPFVRFNMNGAIEPDAILGKNIITPEKGVEWVDGLYPFALRNGFIICEDEWTKAPAFINMATQWLREEGGCLTLYDKAGHDNVVVPDKRARMAYTDNTLGLGDGLDKFAASNMQDTSTINRHGYFIHAGYLPQAAEENLLHGWFGNTITNQYASKLVSLGNLIRHAYSAGELTLAWSPRNLKAVATLAIRKGDGWYGFENAYLNSVADLVERDALAQMYNNVFGRE